MPHHETLIIGAGLAGLSCALELHKQGRPFLLLEKSDSFGGRVRTDKVDGFLLDRGFQVFLDAYPEASNILNLSALDLQEFEPGALVFHQQKLHRVMDVFRRPQHALSSLRAPVGKLRDKALVARLQLHLKKSSLESIAKREDISTAQYLRNYGFSELMIERFFRSFYGGIFLENELRTSSRMFEFTFKMFSLGAATLPANGMEEIPRQIAAQLPEESLRYRCRPLAVGDRTVELHNGETFSAPCSPNAFAFKQMGAILPTAGTTRRPIQRTGFGPSSRAITMSSAFNVSTARGPSTVSIMVPATKHGIVSTVTKPTSVSKTLPDESNDAIS